MSIRDRKAESIRAGIIMFNLSGQIHVFVAQGMEREIEEHRERGFRYAVCNFGLYYDQTLGHGKVGHANELVFDLVSKGELNDMNLSEAFDAQWQRTERC
eukprot:3143138-Prymnesium_polylepis.1